MFNKPNVFNRNEPIARRALRSADARHGATADGEIEIE